MTNGITSPTALEGVVEAANATGVRVQGTWASVSKFHPLELPDRGARVRLELDAKGFIKSLQVLDQAPSASSSNRERTINRSVALKAAAAFAAGKCIGGVDVKSTDVLRIAEAWLDWLEEEAPTA